MNIQPLNDFYLLKLVEAEERTVGGIILPDAAQERPDEGVVEAIPADSSDDVKIGDRVIFKRFAGEDLASQDGAKYKLIPYGDLLAKYVVTDAIPE